jgi:hypothetical protein
MQMSQKYVRLTKTVADLGILIKPEEVYKHIYDPKIDHYVSTYYYDQNHFKEFNKKGSVKGLLGQKTNKVWFDFDSENDLKLARKDAVELINRLQNNNINPEQLEIYFSGNKGFNVILNLTKELNRKQVENFAQRMAGDLKTFDSSLYDENQILRVPGTKHDKTECYKIPLTFEEISGPLKNAEIKERAKNKTTPKEAAPSIHLVNLDDSWFEIKEVEKEIQKQMATEFDLTTKPRGWKASKWALLQGFIKAGERDTSMMVLASTLKSMGYDETQAYSLCKDALKKSWARYGEGNFTREDLWAKIERIFSPEWKGGTYSEEEDVFLTKKGEELGIRDLTQSTTVDIKSALKMFKGYAKNISAMTLKTGIKELDDKQRITVGMSWGIIAGPGSGKSSIALQIVHSMSKAGELCVFFSYDMFGPHVIQKIIQTHWGKENEIDMVLKKYEENDLEYVQKVEELIEREYPNVEFCFESGQSLEEARHTIRDAEIKRGMKCRFAVFDYNELVVTDVADPTQSSNKVAQGMRALAGNEQICVLSLFQPSKMTGDPTVEIKSYRAAKGGSGIEQSVSLMFGMSRPGYTPRPENDTHTDKFVSLNCVKNRMGPTFALDFFWNGYRGLIRSLKANEKAELIALRKSIEDAKNGNNDDGQW